MLNKYITNYDSDIETIDFTSERISSISTSNNSNCLSKIKKRIVKPNMSNNDNDIEQNLLLFYDHKNNTPTNKRSIFSFCIII